MSDGSDTSRAALPRLLTEAEVAERLGCSRKKIQRLRTGGHLSYFPGRPVLIDEADLEDYLARVNPPPPSASEQAAAAAAKGARRAREAWLKRRPPRVGG